LPLPVTVQPFEPIAWNTHQIVQRLRSIQQPEFYSRLLLQLAVH